MKMEALCGADTTWCEQIVARFPAKYVGPEGIIITALDGQGRILDAMPLVADFGDVLPFLERFGKSDFVRSQVDAADAHLSNGLFRHGGRTSLFYNHDWLLGLLELNEITADRRFLALAVEGAREIIETMFVNDILIDEKPNIRSLKSLLGHAAPFNGGYIELWLELEGATMDSAFRDAGLRLGRGWTHTSDFEHHGVFSRVPCAYSSWIGHLIANGMDMRARLFKDNTNLVWGLLALAKACDGAEWSAAIDAWLSGFERYFLNDGAVYLWLDQNLRGKDVNLRAAFSTIDLFCDIAHGLKSDRALGLAQVIADRWLTYRWGNGIFPERPSARHDHLDANVDMAIALLKLSALTKFDTYAEAARRTAEAVIRLHRSPHGYVLAINPDAAIVDDRIIVKYQSLMLKLALAPSDPASLMADDKLLYLLRDR